MRFNDILLEYNRDATVKNYGEKILAVALTDRSTPWLDIFSDGTTNTHKVHQLVQTPEGQQRTIDYIMGVIEQADPTKNKNYAQAIARLYSMGGTLIEDIGATLSQYLIKFDKLKNKKKIQPPYNDFMRYKSVSEFYDVVDSLPDPDSEVEQQKVGEIQFPPDNTWRYVYGKMDSSGRILTDCVVIQPLDKYAGYWWAKEYPKKGVTNRWCTAWEGDNSRFDYYAKQGPLYIIIPAKRQFDDEKFQFHFETKQFMDYQDHQIGDDGISSLTHRFPVLSKLFVTQAIKYNILGLMPEAYKDAIRSHSREASKQLDALINQYKERIAGFGFNSLGDYGISIPEEVQQQLVPEIMEYLDEVRPALTAKDGFWGQVVSKLGSERSEDRLEVFLNTDRKLKDLSENSEAGRAVAELSQSQDIKSRIDTHHLQDLLLRDPLFRFVMRQVPKLYQPVIDELTGQMSQQISEAFNSKQEVIDHFVKQGKSAAAGAAAWERGWRGAKPKTATKPKPQQPQQRYWWQDKDDEDIKEDDWHGQGDAWHGEGNEPVDAWHSPDGAAQAQGIDMIDIEEDSFDNPVTSAITRRIIMQRTDLLAKYGPEKVGNAIDEVAEFVGDVDEIGTSDVSGWVRHVEQLLGNMGDGLDEDWQKVNKRDKTDGMSQKAVNAYRREHPGSKLKTAVTTKPSKLKKGSKASKRRSSYCSRSKGQMDMHNISCAKTPDKAICKARRRWNCESVEDMKELLMIAESIRRGIK